MSEYLQDDYPIFYYSESENKVNPFTFNDTTGIDDSEEQLKIEDQKRYYNDSNSPNNTTNRITQGDTSSNKNIKITKIFNVMNPNQENNTNQNNLLGHIRQRPDEDDKKCRRKYGCDNILSKVEVHFSEKFILNFINQLIDIFDENPKKINNRFIKIAHNLIKNVSKKKFDILLKKKISDILSQTVSDKYKHFQKDNNQKLCEEIEENYPIINKILEQNYLTLFQNFYYPSKREINLKKICDIEKTIYLSGNVETFKDLIKKEEKKEENDSYYASRIREVVNEYFFNGKLKFFS